MQYKLPWHEYENLLKTTVSLNYELRKRSESEANNETKQCLLSRQNSWRRNLKFT